VAIPFWLKKACSRLGVARYLPQAKKHIAGDPSYVRYYSDRMLAAPLDDLFDPAAFP
jgi:hypothetical protein